MANSKKLEWKKIEAVGELEHRPSSSMIARRKTILFDDHLLCFSDKPEICVFDLVNSQWSKIIPKNSEAIQFCYTDFYVIDQSAIIALESKFTNYTYIGTSLHQLTIDKTKVPLQIEVQSSKDLQNFRHRFCHSAQSYKKNIYIFGGNDEHRNIRGDFFIFDSDACTYLQTDPNTNPKKRFNHSSLIHNERLFIYGGMDENYGHLNDVWAWNLTDDSSWECIFSNERFPSGLIPAPSSFSLMQGFENTLFILQKHQENSTHTLLSYDMDSYSWENLNLDGQISSDGGFHIFSLYNNKFILGKKSDLYEADLFNGGSLKTSKDDGTKDVASDFRQLFKEKLFCDVTFQVENEEIPAHKGILAGRSDYFKKMFTSKMSESQSQTIEVLGVKKDVFKALIEFLYCGSTNMTEAIALDLLKLSDEYQLEKLRNRCEIYLMYHLKPESVIDVINTADKLEVVKLRKAALRYIITNVETIKEVDNISRLTESVLCDLIANKSD